MASIGVFTIASKNYLAYVRVLLESVTRIHPEYKVYLCLADKVDGCFDPTIEPYTIVQADDLSIPHFADFALRYDIMEFNTAVKPFMFRWLFNNTDLDAVIYLDPDIQVFSRLDRLESLLSSPASIVLTPHITKPLEDGKSPSDYSMLQAGVFNLGFIGARRCGESLDFMEWWGRRLVTQCINDLQSNLFVDQKWCDLAPCLLENLKILRDEGYNTAYWNLAQRKVSKNESGVWLSNSFPLVFFHFSGINPLQKQLVSKHQNRFGWSDILEVQPLFEAYNSALMKAGWSETRNWPYAYDLLSDWGKLTKVLRQLYRDEVPRPSNEDLSGNGVLIKRICNEQSPLVIKDSDLCITKLMYSIYIHRSDLQSTFNLSTPEGRRQFANWFEVAGKSEYDLPREVYHQELISGRPGQFVIRKTFASFAYRSLVTLTPLAKTITQPLPVNFRNTLKRIWGRLKSQTISRL